MENKRKFSEKGTVPFDEFWKILLYSGKDLRWGDAHNLYEDYKEGIKTQLHIFESAMESINWMDAKKDKEEKTARALIG
jgi:hypothetical protein